MNNDISWSSKSNFLSVKCQEDAGIPKANTPINITSAALIVVLGKTLKERAKGATVIPPNHRVIIRLMGLRREKGGNECASGHRACLSMWERPLEKVKIESDQSGRANRETNSGGESLGYETGRSEELVLKLGTIVSMQSPRKAQTKKSWQRRKALPLNHIKVSLAPHRDGL